MKKLLVTSSIIISQLAVAQSYKFDFGTAKVAAGYTQVLPSSSYNESTGYGFEFSKELKAISSKGNDALTCDYITSSEPFYFSVKLPEGNYNVRVMVGDLSGTSKTTIKAECRRLMIREIATAKGKIKTAAFTVHVHDSIIRPSGEKVRLKSREVNYLHWDKKLTLEFNNSEAKICAVEIEKVNDIPTVFLAGNSTVVDQSTEPWASWGQMIPSFFEAGKLAIANYAESGETLKAFKGERRLEKIWSMSKPGDYLFIEFAHNDQKPGGNHLDPFTSYAKTLSEWIKEARARQMTVVLVTSTNRRTFDSTGHIYNSLGDYPAAMRKVAMDEGVALIDLNDMSRRFYEAMGPTGSINAFVHFPANAYPNYPKDVMDNTHFSTYGAYELAKCVLQGIRNELPALAKFIKQDVAVFDPSKPAPFSTWDLPPSSFVDAQKPDGN